MEQGNAASSEQAEEIVSPQSMDSNSTVPVTPQTDDKTCVSCTNTSEHKLESDTAPFIYVLGRIEAHFPSPSVEKEFAQAIGRTDTAGQTDQKTFHAVLSKRENRYLVRRMCWVLKVQGLDTYILVPRDPADYDLIIDSIRPKPSPLDIDVIIGKRGPMAPPDLCNGLMVPVVVCEQIYNFDSQTFIKSIPKPKEIEAEKFTAAAEELFQRIMQMTDNAGSSDEHRALNYIAMRYPAIYATATERYENNFSLSSIEVRLSTLSGTRKIVDVIFSYTNRNTDVTEKYFTRVDVTEEFPFLVSKISTYFDR